MEFSLIKGFKDILPQEAMAWHGLESVARDLLQDFGFQEIRLPLMERTELFSRGIGQETDIVSKEMYTLLDSKGRGMTLRPEATASVVRAYIQNRLDQAGGVQKLFTIGPMFRHERPQKGRFRQFHQINAEMFGDQGPKSDAELVVMAMHLFDRIGLRDVSLNLNSLGCAECRPAFRQKLTDFLTRHTQALCADCRVRAEKNPLRVFDCKVETCNQVVFDAPLIREFLCASCKVHFNSLLEYLSASNVPFVLNDQLVRGLDYYNRTTFEIRTQKLGAQNAVAGGGRYDGLVKLLGGPDQPAIGFAVGVERVIALLEEEAQVLSQTPDLFVAALGEKAEARSFNWIMELRKSGLWVEMDYSGGGLKSQMKRAGRLHAKMVLIVGDEEISNGKALLRNMVTKDQVEIGLDHLTDNLKEAIKADG